MVEQKEEGNRIQLYPRHTSCMSTPETDLFWQEQQSIVEGYAMMCKSMKNPALHKALQIMCEDDGIHERTKEQLRALYNTWLDTQGDEWADVPEGEGDDPNIAYQEYVIQKERDEAEKAEQHYAPSEGFDR